MRIPAAALVASALGCRGAAPPPAPAPPSCATAWAAITASLVQLHRDAGRPDPALPDRAAWIATCEGLALSPEALRCLEPGWASAHAAACAPILAPVDRTPLDRAFFDAMLPAQGDPP